ncbi:MAG TPA: hypothetical protein VJ397_07860 [Thermoplasmata archaeon]|nr:hypothetical protein [Thermoplasmata archaeon]
MGPPKAPRWTDANSDFVCDTCLHPLEQCRCACPYCGETAACTCTIGPDAATGG